MVTARRWLAMMLLPSAAHLMNQILQNLRVGLPDKHIRIEPNSVATEVADPAGKFIGRRQAGGPTLFQHLFLLVETGLKLGR